LHFFDALVFSDEIGYIKPHAFPFQRVSEGLGVPLPEILHIGDDIRIDVLGAQRAGARAALFTGVYDMNYRSHKTMEELLRIHVPPYHFHAFEELPALLEAMERGDPYQTSPVVLGRQ
jgi:FMN phosphatase YigB (HAD superfamily)